MSELSPERIMQFAWGFGPPLMVEAAVRHGVFDTIDGTPKSAAEVATATGASERGLRILMDGLVGLDLLEKADGRYSLTPESAAFLISGRPTFQGGIFRHVSRQLVPKWLDLTEIVRRGAPTDSLWAGGGMPEFFRQFVEDILPLSYPAATAAARALGVAEATSTVRLLDIASGSGVWSIAFAQQSPHVQVTAVDFPGVLAITRSVADKHGVGNRYTGIEGSMYEVDFGTGYQIVTLGHVIHSEGEDQSRLLFGKIHDALEPGGSLVIGDFLPNEERTGPPHALLFAVNMLVNCEMGDTFTFSEIRSWLEEAGFGDVTQLAIPGPVSVITARRVD